MTSKQWAKSNLLSLCVPNYNHTDQLNWRGHQVQIGAIYWGRFPLLSESARVEYFIKLVEVSRNPCFLLRLQPSQLINYALRMWAKVYASKRGANCMRQTLEYWVSDRVIARSVSSAKLVFCASRINWNWEKDFQLLSLRNWKVISSLIVYS